MSKSTLRVCMVAPLPPPYGGISHWTAMIFRYAATRNDVKLFSVNIAPRWRAVHDLSLWKRVIGGGFQLMRDLFILCAVLMVRRPHVVHLTTSGQLSVVRDRGVVLLSALFRVPVIYHIRFGRVLQISRENSREWQSMVNVMRKAHTVVAIDAATEQAIQRTLPDVRVLRIPNCVDIAALPQQTRVKTPIRTVLFIGWVIAAKGVAELVKVWAQLQPAGWRLAIIGPGDPVYVQQLLDMYQPEKVDFLGELSHTEAMEYLGQADIFVLPSYTEGFPNVVLEAMALGKAIVATEVGAIPEMLAEGCGKLIKPQHIESLTLALCDFIADEDERVAMGERARKRVLDHYSLGSVFSAYMSVWKIASHRHEQSF